jgi:hypothetical protein
VTVTLLGGGLLRVQTGGMVVAEGDRVFVRDGSIEDAAPTLQLVEIEI